ncbi:DNA lyase [Myxozyma melibiosi]|uniref:DNA-(apurinic or apyrimidinic site) endonuclease n=1 Tax=Myxozyma melibiosi TaxID=54550 RepID=A0ABR1F5K8_9ASCO
MEQDTTTQVNEASLPAPTSDTKIRIVSFNICGIRNVLQYHPWSEKKEFLHMFETMEADIICFQETKIQGKDLTKDMVVVPGFDSYFNLPKSKKGYSGVAVYTRTSKCRAIKAEEGLTGVLEMPRKKFQEVTSYRDSPDAIGGYDRSLSMSEALLLDSEGRSLVLDFGAFVLINVYCPAVSSDERANFRERFQEVLFNRVQTLVEVHEREVVVLGDFNIIRAKIDTADPSEIMRANNLESFQSTFSRALLNSVLRPSTTGFLADLCRKFHPGRKGMYTCWNQKLNARPGNYGSRIDYICTSKLLEEKCSHADIWADLMGSDHCPIYADFLFNSTDALVVNCEPPLICANRIFQPARTLKSMFETQKKSVSLTSEQKSATSGEVRSIQVISGDAERETQNKRPRLQSPTKSGTASRKSSAGSGQLKLTSFVSKARKDDPEEPDDFQIPSYLLAEYSSKPTPDSSDKWKKLFSKPEAPVCSGHGEPCTQRITKKSGINEGRAFWICSRPVGPGYATSTRPKDEVNKDYRCSYFKWATSKE